MNRNVIYKIIVVVVIISMSLFILYKGGQVDGISLSETLKLFLKKVFDDVLGKSLPDGLRQINNVQNVIIVIFLIIGGAAIIILNIADRTERRTHKRTSRWLYRKRSIKSLDIDVADEL